MSGRTEDALRWFFMMIVIGGFLLFLIVPDEPAKVTVVPAAPISSVTMGKCQ